MLYNTGECEIVYKIFGRGKRALLFLHGNGEDHLIFKPQIEYFQNYYKVICADTRGHGKSSRGSKPLDFETISDDFIGLINETGAEKTDIIGFSDGANAALHMALKAPERIGRLVLIGANIFPRGMKTGTVIWLKLCRSLWAFISIFNKKAGAMTEKLDLMLKHPKLSFAGLNKIRSETLVIAGSGDIVKEKHTKEIARNIAGAELKIIPGNHFAAFKKPEEANKIIEDFLGKGD